MKQMLKHKFIPSMFYAIKYNKCYSPKVQGINSQPNSRLKINLISIQANAKQYRLSGDLEWLALSFNNLYIAILSLYLYIGPCFDIHSHC